MGRNKDKKDMTVYEASDFLDEHDFGEFNDVREVNEVRFSLKKKKYIDIDRDLFAITKEKVRGRYNKTVSCGLFHFAGKHLAAILNIVIRSR